jgi:hypothetical protein
MKKMPWLVRSAVIGTVSLGLFGVIGGATGIATSEYQLSPWMEALFGGIVFGFYGFWIGAVVGLVIELMRPRL